MCNKICCHRVMAVIFIVIALALAVTISLRYQQSMAYIGHIIRFFDVMLPVLAVGGLIKYLTSSNKCCSDKDQEVCNRHPQ